MSLNPALLREGLVPLYEPGGMPKSVPEAVVAWGRAYSSYARQAMAGTTLPGGAFAVPPVGGDFLNALDAALRTMWMAIAWAGPGLVGTTTVVPPLQPFILSKSAALIGSGDRQLGLSLITEAVHTYTLSVTATVVPTTGTPFIVPLT